MSDQNPQAPYALTTVAGDQQITVSWEPAPGATSHSLMRALTAKGSWDTVAKWLTETTFVDSGVSNDTQYYYVVVANLTTGEVTTSEEIVANVPFLPVSSSSGPTTETTQFPTTETTQLPTTEAAPPAAAKPNFFQRLIGREASEGAGREVRAMTTPPTDTGAVRHLSGLYNGNGSLPANDDSFTGAINLGFTLNYFGTAYSQAFVSNNGYITFGQGYGTFTPHGLTTGGQPPIIASFFADVDTRGTGSALATYGTDTLGGNACFAALWDGVGYYNGGVNKLNKFQLIIISRPDTGNAQNFDIELNYDQIQWDAGSASGGVSGLCTASPSTAAAAGYTNGSGNPGTNAQLAGSLTNGGFLDGNASTGLIHKSLNSAQPGRYIFQVRNGIVSITPPQQLAATPGYTFVDLNWSAPPNVPAGTTLSYNVYKGSAQGAESGTAVATGLMSTTYHDTAVTVGPTEWYFVTASATTGGTTTESGHSNEASATIIPPPPTSLVATGGAANIALAWSAPSPNLGSVTYSVFRGTSTGTENSTAIATGLASSSYTDSDPSLVIGSPYFYFVSSTLGSYTSTHSNEANASPLATTTPAPQGLVATSMVRSGNPRSVYNQLTWTPISGAGLSGVSYRVYRGTAQGAESGTAIATGLTTASWQDNAAQTLQTYWYYVTAYATSDNIESGHSNEASVQTLDIVPPTFVSARSSTNGLAVYVLLTDPANAIVLPSGGSPASWTVTQGGNTQAATAAAKKGTSGGDAMTVSLTLGAALIPGITTTLSYAPLSAPLTDNQASPNPMAAFSNQPVTNAAASSTPPAFDTAETSTDGTSVDVHLTALDWPPIKPSTPTGFTLIVDGRPRADFTAALLADGLSYRLSLSGSAITGGDLVEIDYSQAAGNVTDSASSSASSSGSGAADNAMLSFRTVNEGRPYHVRNLVPFSGQGSGGGGLFDPVQWIHTGASPASGDLYERRLGWPTARVLLDTTPPVGDVILNPNAATGGMQVHHFSVLGPSAPITGTTVLRDFSDATIRAAAQFGGSASETQAENVGDGTATSLVTYFAPTGGAYPSVSAIQVGITASKEKQYAVEVQVSPNSAWLPLVSMIASAQTRDYFRYAFSAPVALYAVRVHYRGDYYAPSDIGSLSVFGADQTSGVAAMRVSHYPDMHDAVDFSGADSGGWVPFVDGASDYAWALANPQRLWQTSGAALGQGLTRLLAFNGLLLGVGSTTITLLSPSGAQAAVYQTGGGVTIQCIAVWNGQVYAGLSDGSLLRSQSGTSFAVALPAGSTASVTALAAFSGRLWIGVDAGSGGHASVYTYDGRTLAKAHTFTQRSVRDLLGVGTKLFVAVAGETGIGAGAVFVYDGASWPLTLQASADSVDTLLLSTADGRIWAALSGGTVLASTLDTNGLPASWLPSVYDGDAATYYDLSDDPNGAFVWLCGSTGLVAYSRPLGRFIPVAAPSGSVVLHGMAYIGATAYGAGSDGQLYTLDTSTLASRQRSVYVQFKDAVGNVTPLLGISDTIVRDSSTTSAGVRVSDGTIWQVKTDDSKAVVATFSSKVPAPLYAPDRSLRQSGTYESEPFYVATLSYWDLISFIAELPTISSQSVVPGLDSGVQVELYVRTADDRNGLLARNWGAPHTRTTIGGGATGVVDTSQAIPADFNIAGLGGKWLQYRIVLTSASRGVTPVLRSVTLSYVAASATYFYTTMLDTSAEVPGPNPPQYRRFLMTTNQVTNGGYIQYGYTTDDAAGATFDFSQYTPITPNTVTEIPLPSSKIRFGVLLVSISSATPAEVDSLAVQLDAGHADLKLMA